jgi:hypothetical protein
MAAYLGLDEGWPDVVIPFSEQSAISIGLDGFDRMRPTNLVRQRGYLKDRAKSAV